MLVAYLLVAGAAASPATIEAFTVGPAELQGPCHVEIAGKPTEQPPADCAAAIAAATSSKDKAVLHFAWAYSLNEANGAIQALPHLDRALVLAPNFTNARHERAYTLNHLGFYNRALIDANRNVELTPEIAQAYHERAFARRRLGDFEGSLADRLKAIDLEGSTPGAELEVVTDLMWLARYDEAGKRLDALPATEGKEIRADLHRRRQYKPDGSEMSRCILKQSVSDRLAALGIVDLCTWAFDHEANRRKRAEYLTVRAVMSVIAKQDSEANLMDHQIAVALDPENPDLHANYGFALVGARRSWAGRNALNIALANPKISDRTKAIALTGRGQANFNLGDLYAAKADVKESITLKPSAVNVWLAGNIAEAEGDKALAKKFWMSAYRMGARDDRLIKNLKSVGVDDPGREPK